MESKEQIYTRCIQEHPLGRTKGLSVEKHVKIGFEAGMKAMTEYEKQLRKPLTDRTIAIESANYSERIGVNPISAKLDFEAGMKKACELLGVEIIKT